MLFAYCSGKIMSSQESLEGCLLLGMYKCFIQFGNISLFWQQSDTHTDSAHLTDYL